MTTKIAINGYGRIGRNILSALLSDTSGKFDDIKIIAINDLGSDLNVHAQLTKVDSVHGWLQQSGERLDIKVQDNCMVINGHSICMTAIANPKDLPWKGIDVVFECTGRFTSREKASAHLEAGAKKVIVSAPATDADATIVCGVNHDQLKPEHQVISNASCTTNCLATVVKPLQALGIKAGFMTTIHAYTNDQMLTDSYHVDVRRARSATCSMIPTKTGAASTIGMILPELAGRLDGYAMRVPTNNVSVVDLTIQVSRSTSVEEVNQLIETASQQKPLQSILYTNTLPLVSIDFNHHPGSAIADLTQTKVIDHAVKVLAWYDNEWGFSNRMLDLALLASK